MSIFAIFWSRAERLVHVTPVESQAQAEAIDAPAGHDLLGTHERPDDLHIHEPHNGKSIFTEIRELLQTFGGNAAQTAVVVDDGETQHAPVNVAAGEADPKGATDAANAQANAAANDEQAAQDPAVPIVPVAPATPEAPVEGSEGNDQAPATQTSASDAGATDAATQAAADQTAQAPASQQAAADQAAAQQDAAQAEPQEQAQPSEEQQQAAAELQPEDPQPVQGDTQAADAAQAAQAEEEHKPE